MYSEDLTSEVSISTTAACEDVGSLLADLFGLWGLGFWVLGVPLLTHMLTVLGFPT